MALSQEDLEKRLDSHYSLIKEGFERMDKRFDNMHRHTTRWMTALMVVLGLMSVAVTVTNLIS